MHRDNEIIIDIISVDIPSISLRQMALQHPKYLGTSVEPYQDCGFARESGEDGHYFAYLGHSIPETFVKDEWRRANAREAVWLNIYSCDYTGAPLFTGNIRTSSEIITMYNHLNTPDLVVVVEQKNNFMAFWSNYGRDIDPKANSIWLRKR